jgi:hypothetical protein
MVLASVIFLKPTALPAAVFAHPSVEGDVQTCLLARKLRG